MATWSAVARQAAVNAVAPLFNGGTLRFYDAGSVLLATCTFSATAFRGADSSAVAVASAITDSLGAVAGTISYCKAFKADGVTEIGQWTCTIAGGGGDVEMDATLQLAGGDIVRIRALSLSA